MRNLLHAASLLFGLCTARAADETEWTRQFGTTSDDGASVVTADVSGIYVGGDAGAAFPGQAFSGDRDSFLARFDRSGNRLWLVQSGLAGSDSVGAIAADSTGVYVSFNVVEYIGSEFKTNRRALIHKYSFNGTLLWARSLGLEGSYDSIVADATGVYTAGAVTGALPGQVPAGGFDAFVQKYDAAGNLIWSLQSGTPGSDHWNALAKSDGFLYVGGGVSVGGADPEDAVVSKIDMAGRVIWTRRIGVPLPDSVTALAVDSTGIYATAFAANLGTGDGTVRKLDFDGVTQWSRSLGDSGPTAIALDSSAIYVQAGGIRALNRSGAVLWFHSTPHPAAIASDGASVYFAGRTETALAGQVSAGRADAYLSRLEKTGSLDPGLRFVPIPPCRMFDTRIDSDGFFAPEPVIANRVQPVLLRPDRRCGIPADAQAYSFKITAFPREPIGFLTIWPYGTPRPLTSTLNSFQAKTVSNAALVQAGTGGSISVYSTGTTDLLLIVDGYFAPVTHPIGLSFYTLNPCRAVDTRLLPAGPFAAPALVAGRIREFALAETSCQIPAWASAYSLNATLIPNSIPRDLTLWMGATFQPALVSTDGEIVANAAIAQPGSNRSLRAVADLAANLVLDVNGFFGPRGSPGELRFYPLLPCRAADTRTVNFGVPIRAGETRDFGLAGNCGVPASAKAYSLNVTAIPSGPLGYLTLWPSGSARPPVSTLNSSTGRVVANAAIVQAGLNGSVSLFAGGDTHVAMDINGYFQ